MNALIDRVNVSRRQDTHGSDSPNRRVGNERRAVDPEAVPLVPAFVENRRVDAANIPLLVQSGVFQQIQRLGHNMKGNGVMYGFPRIGELGAAFMTAAAQGDGPCVLRLNDALVTLLEAIPRPIQ